MAFPNPRVVFLRLADREYLDAFRWYAAKSIFKAQRFRDAVGHSVGRIAANPAIGAPSLRGCRWVRVRRFPYLLYYDTVIPGLIRVIAVAHQGRRPGYWLRRLSRP